MEVQTKAESLCDISQRLPPTGFTTFQKPQP